MTDSGSDLSAFANDRIRSHGFLSWLGVEIEALRDGHIEIGVPFDASRTNTQFENPSMHGGIAATLVDTAGAFALRSTFDDPMGPGLATIDLDVTYLRPSTGDLLAVGDVVQVGGTIGVVSVVVYRLDDAGRVEAARGRGTYRVFRDG